MGTERVRGLMTVVLGTAVLLVAVVGSRVSFTAEMSSEEKIDVFATLPDWSGIWLSTGTTLLDQSRGRISPNDIAARPRNHPPFNPEWEARYQRFLEEVVWEGRYVDPLSFGFGAGMLRMMAPARGIQIVVRPEQVWIIHERPDVRYIYTDGRDHPHEDLLLPSMEGHSIGHWEGDTLVIDTVAVKGGIAVDRTGMVLSGEAHFIERIRQIDENTLENQITIEDPVAFTEPWVVTRRYRKLEDPEAYMANVNSLENDRNPVVDGQNTMVLGAEGFEFDPDAVYPPDIAALATM